MKSSFIFDSTLCCISTNLSFSDRLQITISNAKCLQFFIKISSINPQTNNKINDPIFAISKRYIKFKHFYHSNLKFRGTL